MVVNLMMDTLLLPTLGDNGRSWRLMNMVFCDEKQVQRNN